MFRWTLPLLFFVGLASAQLQVTTPTAAACAPDSLPVLGVALETVMDGSYGVKFPDDLKRALENRGFQVVPDYSWPLVDRATIGVKGEVRQWENRQGEQSVRVGKVHLNIYDLDTKKTLLNVDQSPATWVFGAPQYQDFLQSVVSVFVQKFCQQN